MKRIGILGDIGSGKTYVAKCFGFPVFIADLEVAKIIKITKVCLKLKKNFLYILILFLLKKKKSLMQFYLTSKI